MSDQPDELRKAYEKAAHAGFVFVPRRMEGGRRKMSEAESDSRKACEALYVDADGVPRCPLCQMPMNGEVESHLSDCQLRVLQESYANGLVAAAVAACAKHMAGDYNGGEYDWGCVCGAVGHWGENVKDSWAEHLRSTVTPEAATKELGRIREESCLKEHQSHIEFENDVYATLVDPLRDEPIKEAEMRKQLLESARWYRQHVFDLESQLHEVPAALERIKAEARWEEHLKLCPKCTRKQRDIIGIRCPDAVALEAAARKEE